MTLRNLKLTTRAFLAFGLICALLVTLGVAALRQTQSIMGAVEDLRNNWLPSVRQAGRIETAGLLYRLDARRFVMDEERMGAASIEKLSQARANLQTQADAYETLVSSPQERTLYDKVRLAIAQYEQVTDRLLELSKTASNAELALYIRDVTKPSAVTMQDAIEALIKINEQGADASNASAEHDYQVGYTVVTLLVIAAVVLTLVVAFVFTRSVVSPVVSLVRATQEIAQGNLSTAIAVSGADELTELQRAADTMRLSLRDTIGHIASASGQLASAAEQLGAITQESTRTAQRQNQETEMAATAVNQMTAAVEEVARNAASASESTQLSERSAVTGQDRVSNTVTSIEKLTESLQQTCVHVEGLAERTQGIAKVLEVIGSIAEQTNLLALNAAIEAARAGEQGRGFAVVADEVRALAHRTQASTQEIESMIQQIHKESGNAVQAMRRSSDEAQATLGTAHEAGTAISSITAAIVDINERNLMIAAASHQQAQVARAVDENLVSIRDLSAQGSCAAIQTAEASQALSHLAVDLNRLVTRFAT